MMKYHKRCRYCRKELETGQTIDHVVPRWVTRLMTGNTPLFHIQNRVTSCHPCNRRKGSMPAAVFASLMAQPGNIIKLERTKWDTIAAGYAAMSRKEARRRPELVALIAEFLKPIPPHFATGEKRVELRDGAPVVRSGMFLDECQ